MSQAAARPVDIPSNVRDAVAAMLSRKAVELRVLNLAAVTDFTDYFIVCSGTNQRQNQAIADAVEGALKAEKVRPLHVEGYNNGRWVLMDYGDFLVHVFDPQTREFYGLERLWSDAPEVTQEFSG